MSIKERLEEYRKAEDLGGILNIVEELIDRYHRTEEIIEKNKIIILKNEKILKRLNKQLKEKKSGVN